MVIVHFLSSFSNGKLPAANRPSCRKVIDWYDDSITTAFRRPIGLLLMNPPSLFIRHIFGRLKKYSDGRKCARKGGKGQSRTCRHAGRLLFFTGKDGCVIPAYAQKLRRCRAFRHSLRPSKTSKRIFSDKNRKCKQRREIPHIRPSERYRFQTAFCH